LARRDKKLADLLDQFVCVRVVQANGMDLATFDFDFDLTSAIVFLNADRTTYARYGSRATRKTEGDNTLEGLRKAMEGVLALHKGYPANSKALAGKQPRAPEHATPEKYPGLKGRFTAKLQVGPKLRQSCVHCHMVGEARRTLGHKAAGAWTDELLFPYPMPEVFGVKLDPKEKARVKDVAEGSVGATAGLRAGDDIVCLEGQPIVSIADVQWVLHRAKAGSALTALVRRGGKEVAVKVPLAEGWRRSDDPQWRTSTWELRRMGLGGLFLQEMTAKERKAAGLGEGALALRVQHVGAYAPHNVAQKAGFRRGDVLVSVDGHEGRLTETQLIARALQKHKPGDTLTFGVLRGGKRQALKLTLP
jgi:membrane-associated protease RseP (regulator of RpoE activity)